MSDGFLSSVGDSITRGWNKFVGGVEKTAYEYQETVDESVAFWTGKEEEDVTFGDRAKVFGTAAASGPAAVLAVLAAAEAPVVAAATGLIALFVGASCAPEAPKKPSACDTDPKPKASTVVGPEPGFNYDINSKPPIPVTWQIYAENCDESKDGLSAKCDFGPLGIKEGVSDDKGVIPINTPLTQKLSGNFPCDITGKNGEVLKNEVRLYPPFYASPAAEEPQQFTQCDYSPNPQILGNIEKDKSEVVLKEGVTFAFPKILAKQCDGLTGADEDNKLVVSFIIENTEVPAKTDETNYFYTATFQNPGDQEVFMKLVDSSQSESIPQYKSIKFYVNGLCPASNLPNYPDYINPTPSEINESELATGVKVTWEPESPPTNCDGSIEGIKLICKFADGDLEFSYGPGDDSRVGSLKIEKTITEPLTSPVMCDLTYINPDDSSEHTVTNAVTLYAPTIEIEPDPPTQCDYSANPQILGTIQKNKDEVYVKDPVTFTFPKILAKQCDGLTGADEGNNLAVSFIIENKEKPAETDEANYSYTATFQNPGDQKVFMKVVDTSQPESVPQYASIGFYVNGLCPASNLPNYPAYINPVPSEIYEEDLAAGVEITWQPESQLAFTNCNGSTEGIKLTCKFADEDLEVIPNEDGSLEVKKTLTQPLTSPVMCNLTYTNPNDDSEHTLTNAVTLYAPSLVTEPEVLTQCDYSPNTQILGNIEKDPNEVYVNDEVKFSFPKTLVKQCDGLTGADEGNQLKVSFIIENKEVPAQSDETSYSVTNTFKTTGKQTVVMKVEDDSQPDDIPQVASIDLYVNSLCPASNLPNYPAYINPAPAEINEENLAAGVEVTWKPESQKPVTNCDGSTEGIKLTCKFEDGDLEVIPSEDGSLEVKKTLNQSLASPVMCDLTYINPDDSSEHTITNAVTLYAPTIIEELDLPTQCDYNPNPQILGIIEKDSAEVYVNDQVNFSFPKTLVEQCDGLTGADPNNNLQVSFIIKNEEVSAQTNESSYIISATFTNPGDQKVFMKVTDSSRPDSVPQYTAISFYVKDKQSLVTPPSYALNIPYSWEEDFAVPMSVVFEKEADYEKWTVSWNFGDGAEAGAGPEVNHPYSEPSTYKILCTLTSVDDLTYQISDLFTITIVPHQPPVANLIVTPWMGPAPLEVVADASLSYPLAEGASIVEYTFNWGDGTEETFSEGTAGHTYECSGSSCKRTIKVTVRDNYGNTASVSTEVSTWAP